MGAQKAMAARTGMAEERADREAGIGIRDSGLWASLERSRFELETASQVLVSRHEAMHSKAFNGRVVGRMDLVVMILPHAFGG